MAEYPYRYNYELVKYSEILTVSFIYESFCILHSLCSHATHGLKSTVLQIFTHSFLLFQMTAEKTILRWLWSTYLTISHMLSLYFKDNTFLTLHFHTIGKVKYSAYGSSQNRWLSHGWLSSQMTMMHPFVFWCN